MIFGWNTAKVTNILINFPAPINLFKLVIKTLEKGMKYVQSWL